MSKGAVSYALNGQPGVSDGTRERILQVAKDLGWKPSLRAKGLSSAKAYAWGSWWRGTLPCLAQTLSSQPSLPASKPRSRNTTTRWCSASPPAPERRSAATASWRTTAVDGFILTDVRQDDSRIPLLQELSLPAVTLNRPDAASPFPAVSMDDCAGVTAAVEHLVSLGHTRIAHVGGGQEYIHGRSRRRAWEAALTKA
ncbi:HTH-type transcriptional regulator MalR, partial [Arthrobacter sp. Hiyo6]